MWLIARHTKQMTLSRDYGYTDKPDAHKRGCFETMTGKNRRNQTRSRRGLPARSKTTRGEKVERQSGGKQPRRVLIAVVSLMVAVGAYFGYRHYAEALPESNS